MTGTNASKISFFHSVFMRSTLIVFICTLCVTGMLTLLNFSSSKEAAFATAHERLTRSTSDLTGLIISPLRFSAPDRGAQVLAEMMTNLGGEFDGRDRSRQDRRGVCRVGFRNRCVPADVARADRL